jgi:hypothetical protein
LIPPQGCMVPTISSGCGNFSYFQVTRPLFDFQAVGAFLLTLSSGQCICFGVYRPLTMLRCKAVFLQALQPASCLPLNLSSQVRAEWSVRKVKLLSLQVFVEMLQCFHNGQQFSSGYSVISLGLRQSLAEVGHQSFVTILYLRQYSTHPSVACIHVDNELLPR